MNQSVINDYFLPQDSQLSEFQRSVKKAIIYIQSNWKKNSQKEGISGSTETIYFKDKKIMTSSSPAYSHCSGACFEAFIRSWSNWLGDLYESEDDMSFSKMKELYDWFFLLKYPAEGVSEDMLRKGGAGGLLTLNDVFEDIRVESIEDPRNARFGDFCQIESGYGFGEGHAITILGTGTYKSRDVIYAWSSNVNYDQEWEFSNGQVDRHGVDYFFINKTYSSGFKRKFNISRIVD